jgi:hypothetical protein
MPERNWKALTLLSIIVPVSLLATFRLTGIIQEPVGISQTVAADTVTWNMSRPLHFLSIEENITNTYAESAFSGSFTVHFFTYYENDGMLDYNDGLSLRLTASANTSVGFIYLMTIKSSETDENAVFDFVEEKDGWRELNNLSQMKISDGSPSKGALFEAIGVDQPGKCTLKLQPLWMFLDQNNIDHWIAITLEIVRYNGTIYQQVNIPIELGMIA